MSNPERAWTAEQVENAADDATPFSPRWAQMLHAYAATLRQQAERGDGEVSDDVREAACDAVAEALGDALDCTRVWSAWGVGTMSEDDFHAIADDSDRVAEIADAALEAVAPLLRAPAERTGICFGSADDLATWLESLHETNDDGAITGGKWEPAQVAACAIRSVDKHRESVQLPPDWRREGMVVVVDSVTGKLLGCMGRTAWDAQANAEQGGRVDDDVMRSLREVAGKPDDAGWVSSIRPSDARAILAALTQNAQDYMHPDDVAVELFAGALKSKLAEARAKGRGGWANTEPGMQQRLSDMLRAHVEKGDPRDVGNFAMFLHQRGESILPAQNAQAEAKPFAYAMTCAGRPTEFYEKPPAFVPPISKLLPLCLHAERARVPDTLRAWAAESGEHYIYEKARTDVRAILAAAPSQPEDASDE